MPEVSLKSPIIAMALINEVKKYIYMELKQSGSKEPNGTMFLVASVGTVREKTHHTSAFCKFLLIQL